MLYWMNYPSSSYYTITITIISKLSHSYNIILYFTVSQTIVLLFHLIIYYYYMTSHYMELYASDLSFAVW